MEDLWFSLMDTSTYVDGPWCMSGDSNVIMNPDEKLGDIPHRMSKSMDFINCIEACGLNDVDFTVPK